MMEALTNPQISYLFGAGASAKTLPTIKELPERIRMVSDFIEQELPTDDEKCLYWNISYDKTLAKNFLIKGLNELAQNAEGHSTIDTYAKKLFLRRRHQEDYVLRFFLSLYFSIEQYLSPTDPRYETFLISILQTGVENFPSNIKLLSWNYDSQFELTYEKILDRGSLDVSLYRFNTRDFEFGDSFCSVKLNGSCNLKGSHELYPFLSLNSGRNKFLESIYRVAGLGLKLSNKNYSDDIKLHLQFAWYHEGNIINHIRNQYSNTNILVVIGYSFPFFNREVDRLILRAMKDLKKIYIQDLNPEMIKSRFLSILPDWKTRGVEIIAVDDVSEFFLPPEL